MPRAGFAVDRQLEDARQTESAHDAEAGAARRQVVDAANYLRRAKFYQSTFGRRDTGILSTLGHRLRPLQANGAIERRLNKRYRQHVGSRPVARKTDISISLHVAGNGMRRHRDVHHDGPAPRTHRFGIGSVGLRHGLNPARRLSGASPMAQR